MGLAKMRYEDRKGMKQKKLLSIFLLTTIFCFQSTVSTLAATNLDDSAIEPKRASYGYYVDTYQNNTNTNMTPESNPSIGVLSKFLDIWTPGDSWDNGTVVDQNVHKQNIDLSVSIANNRTEKEAKLAYLIDRRDGNYSSIRGLGPYADHFIKGANAGTTILDEIPEDATSVAYSDGGNNNGVWADEDSSLGDMVKLIRTLRWSAATTNNAKAYYSYQRPFRWYDESIVVPTLVPRISQNPSTDGGFPSGHTNASYLASYGFAYAVPERYEEIMTSASESGHARILAGMHSPLDVIGGRVMSTAVAASAFNDPNNTSIKEAAYKQAHEVLLSQEGTAHDEFSDYATNKKNYTERLTYGFEQTGDTTKPMVVPKGAEALIETRFPYLDKDQRRWILFTTGLPSGYPVLDDTEGWGRLNLFAAAGGYEAFETDVAVTMDASLGGFHELDTWKNDIAGPGKLTKSGSGTLVLSGNNSYTGGTVLEQGTLEAKSSTAFGQGYVVNHGGTLTENISSSVVISDDFTQGEEGTLELTVGSSEDVLVIHGEAQFGGTLIVSFNNGYIPSEAMPIIVYDKLVTNHEFTSVELLGLPESYDVVYSDGSLRVVDMDADIVEPTPGDDGNDDGNEENPTPGDGGNEDENPNIPIPGEDGNDEEDSGNPTPDGVEEDEETKKPSLGKGEDNKKKQEGKSKGNDTVKNPQTGDDTNIFLYIVLLGASLLTAGIVIYQKKFKRIA